MQHPVGDGDQISTNQERQTEARNNDESDSATESFKTASFQPLILSEQDNERNQTTRQINSGQTPKTNLGVTLSDIDLEIKHQTTSFEPTRYQLRREAGASTSHAAASFEPVQTNFESAVKDCRANKKHEPIAIHINNDVHAGSSIPLDPLLQPVVLHEDTSHFPKRINSGNDSSVWNGAVAGSNQANLVQRNAFVIPNEQGNPGIFNLSPSLRLSECPLLDIASVRNSEPQHGNPELVEIATAENIPNHPTIRSEYGPKWESTAVPSPQNTSRIPPKIVLHALTSQPESIHPMTPPPSYFECVKSNTLDVRSPFPGGRPDAPGIPLRTVPVSRADVQLQHLSARGVPSSSLTRPTSCDLLTSSKPEGTRCQTSENDFFMPGNGHAAFSLASGRPIYYNGKRSDVYSDSNVLLQPFSEQSRQSQNTGSGDHGMYFDTAHRRGGQFSATSDHEALAFFACIMCWPLGLIAIYFSNESRAHHSQGNMEAADKAARSAFVISIISLFTGTVVYISWFVYQHV